MFCALISPNHNPQRVARWLQTKSCCPQDANLMPCDYGIKYTVNHLYCPQSLCKLASFKCGTLRLKIVEAQQCVQLSLRQLLLTFDPPFHARAKRTSVSLTQLRADLDGFWQMKPLLEDVSRHLSALKNLETPDRHPANCARCARYLLQTYTRCMSGNTVCKCRIGGGRNKTTWGVDGWLRFSYSTTSWSSF